LIRKYYLLLFLFSLLSFQLTATKYEIDNVNGDTLYTCSDTLYDSGGPSGNYGNNENYTVTLWSTGGEKMSINFTILDIRTGDTLFIYNGPTIASPLI